MYTQTVVELINHNPTSLNHHKVNLCSRCKNAVWMTTKYSTYVNSGSMQDYLKFLMSNAEEKQKAEGYYRCYCKILHEYHDFQWFEEGKSPHIIDACDAFIELLEKDEEIEDISHGKRMTQHLDVKQKLSMDV